MWINLQEKKMKKWKTKTKNWKFQIDNWVKYPMNWLCGSTNAFNIHIYKCVYSIRTQKLAQIDQRERNRHEQIDQDLASTTAPMSIQTKADEIILLEKQGLCSQKLRNNLAQVTHTIGQNMTDISNIDSNTLTKVERIFSTFSVDFVQFYYTLLFPPILSLSKVTHYTSLH